MKKLILFLAIAGFYSCKKCADCTTTYTTTYSFDNSSSTHGVLPKGFSTTSDPFETCGGDEIKNLEQMKTFKTPYSATGTSAATQTTTEKSSCN